MTQNQEPSTKNQNTKKPSASPRGTRMTEDWMPSQKTRDWCQANLHASVYQRAGVELVKFRNYWLAKSGRDAAKVDWERTFQNWMLNAADRYGTAPTSGAPAGAAPRSFKQMDADDREREHLIVQAMDIILSAHPSMKAAQARQVVLSGIASGELDLNALSSSAPTGYIDVDVINPEVKEVTGS